MGPGWGILLQFFNKGECLAADSSIQNAAKGLFLPVG